MICSMGTQGVARAEDYTHVVKEYPEADIVYRSRELLILLVFVVPAVEVVLDRLLR